MAQGQKQDYFCCHTNNDDGDTAPPSNAIASLITISSFSIDAYPRFNLR